MITKTKTFLLIGDWKDFDTFRKLFRQKNSLYNTKISFKKCNYWDILNKNLPEIKTKEIIILHCLSQYPSEYSNINLKSIKYLIDYFD